MDSPNGPLFVYLLDKIKYYDKINFLSPWVSIILCLSFCTYLICNCLHACHSVPPVAQLDLGQWHVDDALPRLRHPLHDGPVPLVDLPPPEQGGQPLVHILRLGLQFSLFSYYCIFYYCWKRLLFTYSLQP